MAWFDAVSYSRAYMEWLLAQDRQAISQRQPLSLPWEESAPSFLRLPTSDEWEYAARGGNVGSGDQSARTYLIESQGRRQADLHEVASLIDEQTPPPEGSEVMYIGRKKPNLIGIYDTIGNAAEMVLDLFQAIRPDQQLGPPGGYIVMGGNAGQDSKSISVGSRQEVQYYDRDGPVRSPVNGFRLLVSAPFTFNAANEEREPLAGNPRLDEQINAAYSKLVEPTGAGAEERLAAKNEVSRIKEDAARVQESGDDARKLAQDLQVRLQSVLADLDRSTAELNVREAAVRSERFRSLVLAASNMNMVSRIYAQTRRTMAELEALTARLTDPQQVAANKSKIKDIKDNRVPRLRASYCSNLRYYLESVIELSSAEPRDAAGAARRVGDQFRLQVGDFYADFQRLSEQHIEAARAARQVIGHAAETAWRKQIDRGFWDADAPATKFQGFGGEEKPC
jgi:hypothetical protein